LYILNIKSGACLKKSDTNIEGEKKPLLIREARKELQMVDLTFGFFTLLVVGVKKMWC
jgi:hypothetical protein